MIENTIKITKEEFYSNTTRYLEMIEDDEIEKIIIQNDKKRGLIITSKQNYFNNEKRRCCSNDSGKWETIGFVLIVFIAVLSTNFGGK